MRFVALFVPAALLLSGCSNTGTEDTRYVGFSEGRYYDASASKFKDRLWSPASGNAQCLQKDDKFEIRLQSLKVDQKFEGFFEELTSDEGNELGIFLTVSKTKADENSVVAGKAAAMPKDGGTLTTPVERRLVYVSDSRKAKVDINSANLLIYSDKYDDADYKITFEVVEFDADNYKKYASIAKEMAKAAQEAGITYNLPYSALLTKMGSALFDHVSRDDKIVSYETQLLKCGSVDGDVASAYFEKGDLAIVRVSQDEFPIDWSKLTMDAATKRLPDGSYMLLSVIKRN